jgi:glycosyltransferase involved in cell wall biosynthesis
MLSILFYFFIAVILVQLFYYLIVFGKFSFVKPQVSNSNNNPVSILVCAKNELENIQKLFPKLLSQVYPDFEIVLIDDASSDGTTDLFEGYEKKYPNVKVVKVENNEAFWGNKKFALTLGIKAASKEYLLFIDADCYPNSNQWLYEMSSHFTIEKTIVLGYGGYEKIKNSILNKIIRFETLLTATQYFSWARLGKPYMGVGRNLAYKKEEFFNTNGFIDHMKIRSGDDDLFINQAATKANTTVAYNPESFTYSKPKTTYKDWILQKRRHVSTAEHYKSFDKTQLSIFYFSQILFFVLAILLLLFQFQWIIVLILIGIRYAATWLIMGFSASKLQEKDLTLWYPVLELYLLLIQFSIFIKNIFSTPATWK